MSVSYGHCTVLIPAYNTANYIGETIGSVFAQTYTDWDILVVDDGSTDGTSAVVTKLIPRRNLSLLRFERNRGLPSALDVGIRAAQGPVVTFVASDDILYPESLENSVPFFSRNPNLAFAWSNFRYWNGNRGTSCDIPQGHTLWSALCSTGKRGWWNASCQQFFTRRHYLETPGLDTSVRCAVDFQLALLFAELGKNHLFIDKITYLYRFPRKGSLTDTHYDEQYKCWDELRQRAIDKKR